MLNDPKWIEYRLGDIFKGRFSETQKGWYLDKIEKELPDSIGGLYIKRTKTLELKERIKNHEILRSIIEEKSKNKDLPSEDDIVFHIRLGDIVADFKFGEVIFNRENWGLTLKEIEDILQRIKENNVGKKIILVYGSHKTGINQKANDKYLNAIKKLIKENGFIIEEKNSTNPDNDFIYMCTSKIFIRSGGGFSRIIGQVVKENKGIVFKKKKNNVPLSFWNRCLKYLLATPTPTERLLIGLVKRFPKIHAIWQRLK